MDALNNAKYDWLLQNRPAADDLRPTTPAGKPGDDGPSFSSLQALFRCVSKHPGAFNSEPAFYRAVESEEMALKDVTRSWPLGRLGNTAVKKRVKCVMRKLLPHFRPPMKGVLQRARFVVVVHLHYCTLEM